MAMDSKWAVQRMVQRLVESIPGALVVDGKTVFIGASFSSGEYKVTSTDLNGEFSVSGHNPEIAENLFRDAVSAAKKKGREIRPVW